MDRKEIVRIEKDAQKVEKYVLKTIIDLGPVQASDILRTNRGSLSTIIKGRPFKLETAFKWAKILAGAEVDATKKK